MGEWATPAGVMAVVAVIMLVVPIVIGALRLAGKNDLADQLQAAHSKAATLEHTLGSVMQGIEGAKLKLTPESVNTLVNTLRSTNIQTGAEVVVAPIVREIQAGALPVDAVKAETRRLVRRVS